MNLDYSILLILLVSHCVVCSADRLELPAFEFRRQFHDELHPGECPNRIIQIPHGEPYKELCTFPNRTGEEITRRKPVNETTKTVIRSNIELVKLLPLCNQDAASYFGLLAKGDCITTQIAQKLSFGPKTAVLVHLEHDRPRINSLLPSDHLNRIPDEFTLHLNNSYYTEKIDIGTDEAIIAEMWFKKSKDATKATADFYTQKLSDHLLKIVNNPNMDPPRKVKVIRLSSADNIFETKVFKGAYCILDAMAFISKSERNISRVKTELRYGIRNSHLRYTFKAYEIGPIALPYQTVSSDDKRRVWEEIALLQVELSRTYTTNKRYRKFCRSTKLYRKFCLLAKQTLKELKKTITEVHTQRRDWSKLPYEGQISYTKHLDTKIKILKNRMEMVAKRLRKVMKKRQV